MIRLQKYTPEVYYNRSRDFQFIGRLYDVTLNSVKTNADIIKYGLPFNQQSPQELLTLMTMTLGFKPKHYYSREQLLAICSVFSEILRNKGNIKAVQLIGEVILKAEGIVGNVACLMQYDPALNRDLPVLRIIVPEKLAEAALFYDLLEYVVPVGVTVEIVRGELLDPIVTSIEIGVNTDEVKVIRDIDGNLVTKNYRLKTPLNSTNPIQSTLNARGEEVKTTSKNHIANSFVWRRGNNRR
jgi:hypothetical protein